ncbi:MAG: type II toxin-antitoxin system RelE/ParE family toxin [Rhizobiaceae bacterium]
MKPVTVVETPEFLSVTRKLISDSERSLLVDYVANNPISGDLIQGSGGVRKLRWALAGRGKSGGSRIIYFFHDIDAPVFLLTAYAKNMRSDLSQQDVNDMKRLTDVLIENYKGKRK